MKYVCDLCGYVYDDAVGDPGRKIPAGTAFADLPGYYECPDCGSGKSNFLSAEKGESFVHTNADHRYDSQR